MIVLAVAITGMAYLGSVEAAHDAPALYKNSECSYRPGDPGWASEAEDADDIEGGGYLDSSKAARDPKDRTMEGD